LNNNRITGTLPESLQNLTKLEFLYDLSFDIRDFGSNMFNGQIPDWVGKLTSLTQLRLHVNNPGFSGSIPGSIGNLKALSFLYLWYLIIAI
jgi:Leucine-rich repeat (LRR) protein